MVAEVAFSGGGLVGRRGGRAVHIRPLGLIPARVATGVIVVCGPPGLICGVGRVGVVLLVALVADRGLGVDGRRVVRGISGVLEPSGLVAVRPAGDLRVCVSGVRVVIVIVRNLLENGLSR